MGGKVTFRGTFPPIQSAIKIYGDETGMRIQIEIPESDMPAAIELLAMRGKVLTITVEEQQSGHGSGRKIHI